MKATTKNRLYLLTLGILTALIVVATVVYFNSPDTSLKVEPITSLDALVLGKEVKDLDFQDKTFVASEEFATTKDMCGLAKFSSNIYMPVEKASSGLMAVNNKCNLLQFTSLKIQSENLPVNIDYDKNQSMLSFYSPSRSVMLNGRLITIPAKVIQTVEDVKDSSILSICEGNYALNDYTNGFQMKFGELAKCNVKLLAGDIKTNLLGIPSSLNSSNWEFTNGAIEVISGDGREAVTQQDKKFGGDNVVLNTFNDNIYVTKEFPVELKSFEPYLLSFDYSALNIGTNVKWGYRFITQQYKDDLAAKNEGKSTDKLTAYTNNNPYPTSQELLEGFVIKDNLNGKVNRIVETKLDKVIGIQIFLYSQSINSISRITYSNLHLNKTEVLQNLNFAQIKDNFAQKDGSVDLVDNLQLVGGSNEFDYVKTSGNLVRGDNFSFENRLWDLKMSLEQNDCLPDHGGAIIGMAQTDESASDGSKSLILDAKTHYACTKKSFPVDLMSYGNYIMTFDYKNTKGERISSQLKVNGVALANTDVYPVTKVTSGEWQTYAIPFKIDPRILSVSNVSSVELTLVSPSDGIVSVRNLFDNVGLYLVSSDVFDWDGAYFYASNSFENETRLSQVTNIANPNRFTTTFDIKNPFAVSLDKGYSDKFVMQGVNNIYHYKLNNLTNIWLLAGEGSYTLNDNGTGLIVGVRNISIVVTVILFACALLYSQLIRVLYVVKKRVSSFTSYLKKLVLLFVKALNSSNSFAANRLIKPIIFKLLGTKNLSFNNLVELREKAFASLEIMFRQIFKDILNKPVYVLLIIAVGLFVVKYVNVLYAPFVVIFLAWLVFMWDSRLLALAALLQLIVIPILLILKFDRYAEIIAISVYFFLVMTVIMQIIEYWREKKKEK